jgi:hypothetical protein
MKTQIVKYLLSCFLSSPLEQTKRRLARAEAERADWLLAAAEAREAERHFMKQHESQQRLVDLLRKEAERLGTK